MIDDLLLKVKNRKLVVLLVPALGGALLGAIMVVKPALTKIARLQSDKGDLASKAPTFTNIISLEQRLESYRERVPALGDRTDLIESLNAFAAESGLSILSVTPEEKRSVGTYLERVSVKIDAEGNYHQLGDFVSRVENMKQLARILSVEINAEPQDPAQQGADTPAPVVSTRGKAYRLSITIGQFGIQQGAL